MRRCVFMILMIALLACAPAQAWLAKGHRAAATQAAMATTLPEVFAKEANFIAHCSVDPDNFTRPVGPPELHDAEASEHYFDVEKLEGKAPPATRYEFLALCYKSGLDPRKVGLLPYAITEWTERLAVALAEHRKWPHNVFIQHKVAMYAGMVAHYACDLEQPLHTTIHYDGRVKADGASARTGIHLKVDALLSKLPPGTTAAPAGGVEAYDNVLQGVLKEFAASHALVDKVYELEKDLPAAEAQMDAASPAAALAAERLAACVRFTTSLYLTAWRMSEKIDLPKWHQREESVSRGGVVFTAETAKIAE